jgi:hypothetical protein
MECLAEERNLFAFRHHGFWQSMDTDRDLKSESLEFCHFEERQRREILIIKYFGRRLYCYLLFFLHLRKRGNQIFSFIFFTAWMIILYPDTALAYIDPNTGGYVFQLLFPIVSAIGFAYFFLKKQIKIIFSRIFLFIKSVLKKIFVALSASKDNTREGSN